MSTKSDQRQLKRDSEAKSIQPPERTTMRRLLNWFGAVFGIVVLVGAGVLYLTRGDNAITGVVETTTGDDNVVAVQPTAPEPAPPEPQVADEPTEAGGSPVAGAPQATQGSQTAEVIEIEMVEFGYVPETIEIEAGVPVILRFTNTGKIVHEAMIGDAHMQEEFAEAGGHEDGHADGGHHGEMMAITLQQGETRDLEVVIDQPGEWFIGCHLTGHFEAGMVSTISVTG